MSTSVHDAKNNLVGGVSQARAVKTATWQGSGVDLQAAEDQAFLLIVTDTFNDGTHYIQPTESNNNNTADSIDGMAADAYAAISPAVSAQITAVGLTILNFIRRKRFVRAEGTLAGTTTGAAYSVTVLSQKKFF